MSIHLDIFPNVFPFAFLGKKQRSKNSKTTLPPSDDCPPT